MKTEDEVQRAHDLLVGILLGEVDVGFSDNDKEAIAAATDVLCWILDHTHNKSFEENLKRVESIVARAGYRMSAVN